MRLLPALLTALAACGELPVTPNPEMVAARGGGTTTPTVRWTLAPGGFGLIADDKGAYINGTCTVAAIMQVGGDATLDMNAPSGRKCGRMVGILYPDGVTRQTAMFANLNQASTVPIGTTELRRLILNPGMKNGADLCGRVIFGDNGTVGAGTDKLSVARVDATTYQVSGAGNALCEKTGVIFPSSASFTISTN